MKKSTEYILLMVLCAVLSVAVLAVNEVTGDGFYLFLYFGIMMVEVFFYVMTLVSIVRERRARRDAADRERCDYGG